MKKFYLMSLFATVVIVAQFSFKKGMFSSQPPTGLTGANGNYCTNCHGNFGLNAGGGSVTTSGLPTSTFVSGQVYNFSLTINHPTSRARWGFSIIAVNSSGQTVGTMTTTNANAALNGSELSHFNAPFSTGTSYTFNNLRWTAPTNPTSINKNVTFYFVGNAANGTGNTDNDYIYSGTLSTALPAAMKDITASVNKTTVQVQWQTLSEVNTNNFDIEKSDNGQTFYAVGKVAAAGNSATGQAYSFADTKPSLFNAPVYYRVKVVDKDGSFTYSKTVAVTVKAGAAFVNRLYPTILEPGTIINTEIIADKQQTIAARLLDMDGKVLETYTFNLSVGQNALKIQPNVMLTKGMKFLQFNNANLQQTIALMAH